jgi:hypothetical protein
LRRLGPPRKDTTGCKYQTAESCADDYWIASDHIVYNFKNIDQ